MNGLRPTRKLDAPKGNVLVYNYAPFIYTWMIPFPHIQHHKFALFTQTYYMHT